MANCECSDPGCPECRGKCPKKARICLVRIDMEDKTGTLFCNPCGQDALESGLFREDIGAWIRATRKTPPIPKRR